MRLWSSRALPFFSAALAALFLFSCSSTPKVRRTEVDEQIDLSGNWNDTDSRLVAEEMVRDALARAWVSEFSAAKQTKPRVIVGTVLNKSHEHINTETFVKDLERELTNSGQVRFVASKEQRNEVREERVDQAQNASMETAKSMGQEYGADYMVKGQINTILDAAGKQEVKYYQVELELIDMLTNEKAWIGQKKIKKLVKYKKAKF
ncbi:MAG TPA: penicillin-binding protein activator LpoB [Elusimicrobiota bacterium]|nr:penicillin-binding protein activator LpoB [Elusimicrobiota bacterium]